MTGRHSYGISRRRSGSIIAVIYALPISGTLVFLAGCTGPVILRDPETGKTVRCGSDDTDQSAEVAYQRERDCIEDYQRQGYKRVSH